MDAPVITLEPPINQPLVTGRVLVLDDHAPSRDAFAQMMARWNIDCDTAATFDEAQHLRASTHYDTIFADFRLLGDDDRAALAGRVACREITVRDLWRGQGAGQATCRHRLATQAVEAHAVPRY